MKSPFPAILPALCLVLPLHLNAEDAAKTKTLDTFQALDPRTTYVSEAKVRRVPAPEVPHKHALEITADYAKSGGYYFFRKNLPPGGIDSKKYKGVRFLLKSPTETILHFCLQGKSDPDGRPFDYRVINVKGGPEWKPYYCEFSSFRFFGHKSFKNGQQLVFPAADLTDKDLDRVLYVTFGLHETERGNSTISNVQLADLELVAR